MKAKQEWFKKRRRPIASKDDITFSESVLIYDPKQDLHTVGWFDFELNKWNYLGYEEVANFVWTYLPKPIKT